MHYPTSFGSNHTYTIVGHTLTNKIDLMHFFTLAPRMAPDRSDLAIGRAVRHKQLFSTTCEVPLTRSLQAAHCEVNSKVYANISSDCFVVKSIIVNQLLNKELHDL